MLVSIAMFSLVRSAMIGGEQDESLIFGHTHRPFISKYKMTVNNGSWLTDNDFHNTFIKTDEKMR